MVNIISIPAAKSADILVAAEQASAIAKHVNFDWTTSQADVLVTRLKSAYLKHHEVGDSAKTPQNIVGEDLLVQLKNGYAYLDFPDYQASSNESVVAAAVAQMPDMINRTFDSWWAGTAFDIGNPFTTPLTPNRSAVDGSADSWADAIDDVRSDGFNPTVIILDNQLKTLLSAAVSDGVSGVNRLTVPVPTEIAGVAVEFRNLADGRKIEEGEICGIVLDGTQVVFRATEPSGVHKWDETNSKGAFEENAVSYGQRLRYGGAIADVNAATILTLGSVSA